jgi:hypothetical protein
MPGRHVAALGQAAHAGRPRARWLVGAAGGAAIAAALIAVTSGSAGAVDNPVKATFGVTGVATSNCQISTGGSDVYVKPGQELDVKTSIVGLTLLGLPLDLSKLASLNGALVIDPQSQTPRKLDITNTVQKINGLSAGDHKWTWTVSTVQVGLLKVPLGLTSKALKLGAKLSWDGTIHVTDNAGKCGVAVALPSVSASVSASGLPPIGVGIPGIKVTVPVSVPTVSLPGVGNPGGGGSGGGSNGGGNHSSSTPPPVTDNPIPVPAKVVPGDDGSGLLGGGIDFGGIPAGSVAGGSVPIAGGGAGPVSAPSTHAAAQLPNQDSTGKQKTIDLAASRPGSTGEVWVVLAIVAVIALAFVAATYARLYLLKRGS